MCVCVCVCVGECVGVNSIGVVLMMCRLGGLAGCLLLVCACVFVGIVSKDLSGNLPLVVTVACVHCISQTRHGCFSEILCVVCMQMPLQSTEAFMYLHSLTCTWSLKLSKALCKLVTLLRASKQLNTQVLRTE